MQTDASDINLDLTGTYCPMAFVKLRVFADQLSHNQVFTTIFEKTKANEPLIRSIQDLGHVILNQKVAPPNDDAAKACINEHHLSENKITLVVIKVQVKKAFD